MVKYTRRGTQVKNNSYKYGMLGEKYVFKHISCPRCGYRLKRLPANNPGTDFRCNNNHYFQLKSKNKRSFRMGFGLSKLSCGSYKHQKKTLLKPCSTDFLILYYDKPKHQVNKLFWLKNENIPKRSLKSKTIVRKVFSKDSNGTKLFKRCYDYQMSEIEYGQNDCNEVELKKLTLDDDYSYNKVRKKVKKGQIDPYPDLVVSYEVSREDNNLDISFRDKKINVNLTQMTCNCLKFLGTRKLCPHIFQTILQWKNNYRNRLIVRSSDRKNIYLVDLNEQSCTCPHYKFRREICKHLKECIANPRNKNVIQDLEKCK